MKAWKTKLFDIIITILTKTLTPIAALILKIKLKLYD